VSGGDGDGMVNMIPQKQEYPVLVRVDVCHMTTVKLQPSDDNERIKEERKEISFQFRQAWWFVEGDHEYDEPNCYIIFTSKETYEQLGLPCGKKFHDHYIMGKGWMCSESLSAGAKNELLSMAMNVVDNNRK
jgi:hypothetical protein